MNREETLKIMSVLKGAYPNFYRGMTRSEAESIVALWMEMFKDDSYEIVATAVKSIIVTDDSGFPPKIGTVKSMIERLTKKPAMTEQEAWNLIAKAVKNGIYGSEEEFEKLPDELKKLVGSHNQLRDWAMLDSEDLHTVVASNFQRSYKVIAKRQQEYNRLPSDVKSLIDGLSSGFSIEGKKEQNLLEQPKDRPPEENQEKCDRASPERVREILSEHNVYVPLSQQEFEDKRKKALEAMRNSMGM